MYKSEKENLKRKRKKMPTSRNHQILKGVHDMLNQIHKNFFFPV